VKTYYNDPAADPTTRALELVREVAAYLRANPPAGLESVSTYANGNINALNIFYAGDRPPQWGKGLWPHRLAIEPTQDIGLGKHIAITR